MTTTATRLSAIQLDTLQVILGRGCTFKITATRLSVIQIDALLTILVILDGWSEAIGTSLSGCQISSYWQGLYPLWMLLLFPLLLLPPLPNFIVIFPLCQLLLQSFFLLQDGGNLIDDLPFRNSSLGNVTGDTCIQGRYDRRDATAVTTEAIECGLERWHLRNPWYNLLLSDEGE